MTIWTKPSITYKNYKCQKFQKLSSMFVPINQNHNTWKFRWMRHLWNVKGVIMSDLQFCGAISGKSGPWEIIPNKPICRPSLDLVKSKVKLKFWWLHQSSHSGNRRLLREISKFISSETIYPNLFNSWHSTWNKQTQIRRRAIYISMTEFS
jgi:hypothetical protein